MSVLLKKQDSSLSTRATEWQLDRSGLRAQHISGLIVSWQTISRGAAHRPALDIAGLEKITASPWAGQVNLLVEQAIALLEGR